MRHARRSKFLSGSTDSARRSRAADLAGEGTVFQVGVAPNRVDVITGIDAVSFDEAWSRRETRAIAPMPSSSGG